MPLFLLTSSPLSSVDANIVLDENDIIQRYIVIFEETSVFETMLNRISTQEKPQIRFVSVQLFKAPSINRGDILDISGKLLIVIFGNNLQVIINKNR